MFTILLDSSNTKLSVGIAKDNELIDFISYEAWQQQSEFMVKELDSLLVKHNILKEDISDVMVAVGPGSYTGVRIAITIAKTISVALNINIYPVSSLRILKSDKKPSICLINARSNRSYFGVYEGEKVIVNDTILNNDDVFNYINEHPDYLVCGDTKYLKIEGHESNTILEMLSLKEAIKPHQDSFDVKPVYLKD
jgi:tRNA threonylcarbamoyl adenosine modification protein YeaZ